MADNYALATNEQTDGQRQCVKATGCNRLVTVSRWTAATCQWASSRDETSRCRWPTTRRCANHVYRSGTSTTSRSLSSTTRTSSSSQTGLYPTTSVRRSTCWARATRQPSLWGLNACVRHRRLRWTRRRRTWSTTNKRVTCLYLRHRSHSHSSILTTTSRARL